MGQSYTQSSNILCSILRKNLGVVVLWMTRVFAQTMYYKKQYVYVYLNHKSIRIIYFFMEKTKTQFELKISFRIQFRLLFEW